MLPHFVIIGAQKSASTFLQACLEEHKDIYMHPGELPFFESPDYERSTLQDLEKLFENKPDRLLGFKRPNYLGRPEVPARIARDIPHAKLIAVLRNPVERAVSAYYHNIKSGYIPPVHFNEGMRKLIEQSAFAEHYKRAHEIIEFGYYYKYLQRYDDFKKNNQLLVFLHEDILANPLQGVQAAYSFLGVSPGYIPKALNSRPQRVLYNIARLKLITYRNRFMHTYNQDKTRSFPKSMNFVDMLAAGSLTLFDRHVLSWFLPNQKPQVDKALWKKLQEIYAADIERLETYIQRDLSAWKKA